MKSKYIISVKSSGLCFNIMRLIILTKLAKEFSRDLIFLTKPSHIPILRKFNNDCMFIPYTAEHTDRFNNFTRKRSVHIIYDLKYLKYIRSNYIDIRFKDLQMNDFLYINGCMHNVVDSHHKFIVVDYNDGQYDTDILNSINIPPFYVDKNLIDYKRDIATINIKINNPNNTRIYNFWDEIIPRLQKDYKKPFLLISGNNNIKEYLGEKYNCEYRVLDTETRFSNVRGNDIIRGSAGEIYQDLLTCATTDFIPFTRLRVDYPEILTKYKDLNFVTEKVEKFDILAEYLAKHVSILEP